MGSTARHTVSNGILSALILTCGVCFCGLIVGIMNKAVKDNTEVDVNSATPDWLAAAPIWSFGFAYIVPGLIGLIATCVKHKGAYITQMVFSIITLVVMGIVFIMGIFALGALAISHPHMENCVTVEGKCVCGELSRELGAYEGLPYSCGDLTSIYAMAVSTLIIIVLAWILTLTTTILAGIMACSREEIQAGYVLHPAPINGTTVQMGQVAMPPHVTYVPITSDHAQLVNNMAY